MEHFPEFVANHLFLFALLASILILLFWNLFGTAWSGIVTINSRETIRMMNHQDAVLLDIRKTGEFSNGHILGAGNIPADSIGEQQTEMAKYKGKPVILCCENGNDSIRIGRMLKMQGIEKIYCMKGGLQAWRAANLPLTRDTKSDKNPDKVGTNDDRHI